MNCNQSLSLSLTHTHTHTREVRVHDNQFVPHQPLISFRSRIWQMQPNSAVMPKIDRERKKDRKRIKVFFEKKVYSRKGKT